MAWLQSIHAVVSVAERLRFRIMKQRSVLCSIPGSEKDFLFCCCCCFIFEWKNPITLYLPWNVAVPFAMFVLFSTLNIPQSLTNSSHNLHKLSSSPPQWWTQPTRRWSRRLSKLWRCSSRRRRRNFRRPTRPRAGRTRYTRIPMCLTH